MISLLVLASLLLLASGLLKIKAASRVGMGVPILALVEILAGLADVGALFLAGLTARQGLAILVGSVLLVVVSSVQVGLEIRRRQRLRAASEGARLASYVKYFSRLDPPAS